MSEGEETTRKMEMAERVRPLVNEILEGFNRENISPEEAGMVILALIGRLLGALEEQPESRRIFILNLIELINSFLLQEAGEAPQTCPGGSGEPQ